jgi:Putative Flp pilus-assembly TadE/G-like
VLTIRLRDEQGAVLVFAAFAMSVVLLLAALAIDGGTWFTHKRQLQNRVDAAAYAAGVQYEQVWRDCLGTDAAASAAAATQIENVARQYSGDPGTALNPAPVATYNTDVVPQAKLGVAVNSTTFGNADNNDSAGSPCVPHAADSITPAGAYWTDIKAKETSPVQFFGMGIGAPNITAQARVALQPELSQTGFSPLAVQVPSIASAQLRIYNICTGALIGGPYNLGQLGTSGQTIPGEVLWGLPDANGNNQPMPNLQIPTGAGCSADYVRIGAELRVAGKSGINLTTTGCVNTQFVSCWTDVGGRWGPEARAWITSDPTTGPPLFKDFHLGSGTCSPDPYFSRTPSCNPSGASVVVDWGDRSSGTYTVTVSDGTNNLTMASPGGGPPNGTWTSNSSALTWPAAGGDAPLTLSWSWTQTTGTWRGNTCTTGGANKCKGSGTVAIQRGFVADDTNSDIVQLAKFTNTPDVSSTASEFDSVQATGNTVSSVYATFSFNAANVIGAFTRLRASTSQSNGSINCDNSNQGSDFSMLLNGCTPSYGVNNFNDPTWWPCPNPTSSPAFSLATNTPTNPWRCGPGAPGLSPATIADGIAAHTGNCNINNNQTGCNGTPTCANTNKYVLGQTPDSADPRLITVFLVPYGAFTGQNGSSFSVPIIDFGEFYVTAWGGTNRSNTDPCPDNLTGVQGGEIDGRFVDIVTPQGTPDPNAQCDPKQLRPCLATLVY